MGKLYDSDFYGWTLEQADALKRRSIAELDWDDLREEIETLRRNEEQSLEKLFEDLLVALLRHAIQSGGNCGSERNEIELVRMRIRRHLDDSPSLATVARDVFGEAYECARMRYSVVMGFSKESLPERCPFTFTEANDSNFLPPEIAVKFFK